MRILLVKMSSMGDIIHNMPLVHDLKVRYPVATIDWVVEESFVELAKLNPLVDRVISVGMRRWKKALLSKSTWLEFLRFKKQLQSTRYDVILDTQGLIKSALIAQLAHGKSYGQNAHTVRERLAGYMVSSPLDIPRNLHAITRNRLVGARAFNYVMDDQVVHYDMQFNAEADVGLENLMPNNCILLFHSTARLAKHWPHQHWISLGQHLNAQGYALALPWGSQSEKKRAELIAQSLKNAVVLPQLSIVKLASLMRHVVACIGLDTGLTHIAVALNVPTLAIFTDTHIWQAGTKPSPEGCAMTIGAKPSTLDAHAAIEAFNKLMAMKSR